MKRNSPLPAVALWRDAALDLAARSLDRCGEAWLTVQGGSMGPDIRSGDQVRLVGIQRQAGRTVIERGWVVAYRCGTGRVVVHRALAWRRKGARRLLSVKGDAAREADPRVEAAAVLGRVVEVRRGGLRVDAVLGGRSGRRRAALSGLEGVIASLRLGRFLPGRIRQAGWQMATRALRASGALTAVQPANRSVPCPNS